jgi:hypothetical protein
VACFSDSIMWHYQLFSSLGEKHQGALLEHLTVGIVFSIFQGNYSRFWHDLNWCGVVGLSCRLWRIHGKQFGFVVSETVPVWVSSLVHILR